MELTKETKFKTSIILSETVKVMMSNLNIAVCHYEHQEENPFVITTDTNVLKFNSLDDMVDSLGKDWYIINEA